MGVYTNLADLSQSIKQEVPRVGLDRSSAHQLKNRVHIFDAAIRAPYAALNEVQTIPEQTDAGAGDTYTLTIDLPWLAVGTFTTAGIAYDAVAATIETAIDVAATAAGVTGWVNGDISVAMVGAAGLDDGAVTLTFDGASVANTPATLTVLTATGFTKTDPIVRTIGGQVDREATQALFDLGIVSGTLHQSLDAPADWVRPTAPNGKKPRIGLIKDLATQASYEDGTDEILAAVAELYQFPK